MSQIALRLVFQYFFSHSEIISNLADYVIKSNIIHIFEGHFLGAFMCFTCEREKKAHKQSLKQCIITYIMHDCTVCQIVGLILYTYTCVLVCECVCVCVLAYSVKGVYLRLSVVV